jgi:rRNA maturation protein Nop10
MGLSGEVNMDRRTVWLVLGLLLNGWVLPVWAQEATVQRTISEKWIARLDPSSSKGDSIKISPDCRRVAFEGEARSMAFVVVDGKEGKPYDRVSYIKFSPDSRRMVHLAKTGEKWLVVIDGREEKAYDRVTFPVFSHDSRRLAYMAKEGRNWFLVLDGKEGPRYAYDELLYLLMLSYPPKFSPDNRHIPYFAKADKKFFVVVNGKEEKKYDFVSFPAFSADGKLAYNASVGDKSFIVVDGKEGTPYDSIGVPQFSPDGKRLAYDAKSGKRAFLVVDGREEMDHEAINKSPIFSPDGRRLAYGVRSGQRELIVIDGKEEKTYDVTGFPRFSLDNRRVAYPARRGNRWLMVVNGREGREYDYVHQPNFSPDSRQLAYRVKAGNKSKVVLDGKEGKEYDEILGDLLVDILFDSSQRFHYLARRGNDLYLVEEGTAGPEKGEQAKESEPIQKPRSKTDEPRAEATRETEKASPREREKEGAIEKGKVAEGFNQDRASLFREAEGEAYWMKFMDESFVWFLNRPNLRVWQIGPKTDWERFVAEVDLWRVEGPRSAGFGLYVKRKDSDDAWWAGISSNGYYQVQKKSSGKVEEIRKWTRAPYILGRRHRFRLEVQPGLARLSIDGNLVAEAKDEFIRGGQVGLYAATPELAIGPEDTGALRVKFDNFSVEYEGQEKTIEQPMSRVVPPQPSVPAPPVEPARKAEKPARQKYPEGIDPKQTSDDPTYAYTIENPVKVGGPKGASGPQSERLYLDHLRDSNFRPLKYNRAGSFGTTLDNHIVDGYKLISEDGKEYFIYMDMYHPEIHPLQQKAPKGLYIQK